MLALITSQYVNEPNILELELQDVENGSLDLKSYLRPCYLFAIAEHRIGRRIGNLTKPKLNQAIDIVKALLDN